MTSTLKNPTTKGRIEELGLKENKFKEILEGPPDIVIRKRKSEHLKEVEDFKEKRSKWKLQPLPPYRNLSLPLIFYFCFKFVLLSTVSVS